jgi:hypothetical protein
LKAALPFRTGTEQKRKSKNRYKTRKEKQITSANFSPDERNLHGAAKEEQSCTMRRGPPGLLVGRQNAFEEPRSAQQHHFNSIRAGETSAKVTRTLSKGDRRNRETPFTRTT